MFGSALPWFELDASVHVSSLMRRFSS